MNCKWKYFVVLNNGKFPHNIVEAEEDPRDGLPLCCDFSVAVNFNSPDELNKWVKEHTSLRFERGDYHIEGHYLPEVCIISDVI